MRSSQNISNINEYFYLGEQFQLYFYKECSKKLCFSYKCAQNMLLFNNNGSDLIYPFNDIKSQNILPMLDKHPSCLLGLFILLFSNTDSLTIQTSD